jgi:hypothetical protein
MGLYIGNCLINEIEELPQRAKNNSYFLIRAGVSIPFTN